MRSSPNSSAKSSDETVSRFDAAFEAIVGPKLVRLVIAYAYLVQTGVVGFGDAWAAVWRNAIGLGALHLSDEAAETCQEWISNELIARIDDPPPPGVLSPRQIEALRRWPAGGRV